MKNGWKKNVNNMEWPHDYENNHKNTFLLWKTIYELAYKVED